MYSNDRVPVPAALNSPPLPMLSGSRKGFEIHRNCRIRFNTKKTAGGKKIWEKENTRKLNTGGGGTALSTFNTSFITCPSGPTLEGKHVGFS